MFLYFGEATVLLLYRVETCVEWVSRGLFCVCFLFIYLGLLFGLGTRCLVLGGFFFDV